MIRFDKQAGGVRLNIVAILGLVGLGAIGVLLALGGVSPEAAAEEFMQALAKKDVNRLVELTYLESPREPLKDQWDDCVNRKAKNFVFMWSWIRSRRSDDDKIVMQVTLTEFTGPVGSEKDPISLALVQKDGRWKVDLASITRSFFPGLPR